MLIFKELIKQVFIWNVPETIEISNPSSSIVLHRAGEGTSSQDLHTPNESKKRDRKITENSRQT
jgi:hypothetical protein